MILISKPRILNFGSFCLFTMPLFLSIWLHGDQVHPLALSLKDTCEDLLKVVLSGLGSIIQGSEAVTLEVTIKPRQGPHGM